MHRRRFLAGLVTALATPAIVRAESLMPTKLIPVRTTVLIPPKIIEMPAGITAVSSLRITFEINGDMIRALGAAEWVDGAPIDSSFVRITSVEPDNTIRQLAR